VSAGINHTERRRKKRGVIPALTRLTDYDWQQSTCSEDEGVVTEPRGGGKRKKRQDHSAIAARHLVKGQRKWKPKNKKNKKKKKGEKKKKHTKKKKEKKKNKKKKKKKKEKKKKIPSGPRPTSHSPVPAWAEKTTSSIACVQDSKWMERSRRFGKGGERKGSDGRPECVIFRLKG